MVAHQISRKRSLPVSVSKASSRKFCMITSSVPNKICIKGVNPQEFIVSCLESRGVIPQIVNTKDIKGFFVDPTEEEMMSYKHDIIAAVRAQDIDMLRKFYREGRTMKCSNKFGESLLHLACRKQYLDVVNFFVEEAGVTVQVSDDYGRTPLHDACWTSNPNFELMKLLIRACPDMLFMKDARGYTPISYARKEHWGLWNKFLNSHSDILTPNVLVAPTQ